MTADGMADTQLRVPGKTNEITCFAILLTPYDLTGVTVNRRAGGDQPAPRGRPTNIAAAVRAMSYQPFTRPLDPLHIG
ncbi:hypothetical protein [Streptomyces sp. NPDC001292]|uniref:hypothetical protein n=1 Tax=Streptomyces sp. NPDC001292 TaxID=3364558 RepID=UPI0036C3AB92